MLHSKTGTNSHHHTCLRYVIFALLLLGADVAWSAAATRVTAIKVGQQSVAEVANIKILYPQDKQYKTITLKVNAELVSGTDILTPANTEITLTSINGNILTVRANTHYKLISADTKGESHEVLRGGIWTFIRKQLSFYSVNSRATAAAARRTEYTVDVGEKQDVTVKVITGTVELERSERIAVDGKEFGGYKDLVTLNANEERTVERRPEIQRFSSFAEARTQFEQQVASAKQRGDQWGEAESQYNLAQLTYDAMRNKAGALAAVQLYKDGLALPISQQDPRWEVLFTKGVGDSLFDAGDFSEAHRYHSHALEVLKSKLDPTLESYQAADLLVALGNDNLQLGHPEQASAFFQQALDVFEDDFDTDEDESEVGRIYFSLGVAHQRLNKGAQAREFFQKSLKIEQESDPDTAMVALLTKKLRGEKTEDEDDYVDFDDVPDEDDNEPAANAH